MDKAFDVFVSWQLVALSLAIWMLVFAIRRVVETVRPGMKTNIYWAEIFLPLGPIGTGLIIALVAKKFPWPAALGNPPAASARMMFAAICGLFSGFVYNRFKSFVK